LGDSGSSAAFSSQFLCKATAVPNFSAVTLRLSFVPLNFSFEFKECHTHPLPLYFQQAQFYIKNLFCIFSIGNKDA
jgi:hypothetical protein